MEGRELDTQDIKEMAELYAELNVQATAGKAFEIRDFIQQEYSYKLWQEYDRTSILAMYMDELLEDAVVDYNERRRP